MRHQRYLMIAILLCCGLGLAAATEPLFKVEKLSERAILLIEQSPMENIIAAVAGSRGIAVIDTGPSVSTAARARELIARTFKRDDFAWVINTHPHWDHVFGNQVWSDARFAAHELAGDEIRNMTRALSQLTGAFAKNLTELDTRLAAQPESSPDRPVLVRQREFARRNLDGLRKPGFQLVPPGITFRDRMTIHLGDRTLRLVHFGRAHSNSDIFIHVPEEGLLFTGDLFLDRGWLPLFAGLPTLDIPRWIEVLNESLAPETGVRTVVPGHRGSWTREKLALWRDYIVDLWSKVNSAFKGNRTVDDVINRTPLAEPYLYLKELGHTDERLKRFQETNIRAFWRQVAPSAAREIEKTIQEGGAAAAEARFKELRSGGGFNLDERELNTLGYSLLGGGKTEAAVAVFRMNVDLFPGSANVYDSLAEALIATGDRAGAIRNYQKVLAIAPANTNALAKLRELQASEDPKTP